MGNDILEFNTEDIRDSFDKPVNLGDLENYVESHINNSPNTPQKTKQNLTPNSLFYIPQSDYINYRIYLRDRLRKERKRVILWRNLQWIMKTIFAICLFLVLCWGFYLLAWFIQNSMYINRMTMNKTF